MEKHYQTYQEKDNIDSQYQRDEMLFEEGRYSQSNNNNYGNGRFKTLRI
jgi:hypothetical protein